LRGLARLGTSCRSASFCSQPFVINFVEVWLNLVMLDWAQCAAVGRVPGKVTGAWVFKTTRVPMRALFENLEDGATVNDFRTWFPGVTREQVEAALPYGCRNPIGRTGAKLLKT
jgi:uncharacterized protein (DUF433 family)